jgi:hypothetical protein
LGSAATVSKGAGGVGERSVLGKVLAAQAVGVFVGRALPWGVGSQKEISMIHLALPMSRVLGAEQAAEVVAVGGRHARRHHVTGSGATPRGAHYLEHLRPAFSAKSCFLHAAITPD